MGGYVHDVEIEGGRHRLVVDEPLEAGGTDAGPSPTRLLAAGLASCIAITMEMYAKRKQWEIGAVEVESTSPMRTSPRARSQRRSACRLG